MSDCKVLNNGDSYKDIRCNINENFEALEKKIEEADSGKFETLEDLGLTAPVGISDIFAVMEVGQHVEIEIAYGSTDITGLPEEHKSGGILELIKAKESAKHVMRLYCQEQVYLGLGSGNHIYWDKVMTKSNMPLVFKDLGDMDITTPCTTYDVVYALGLGDKAELRLTTTEVTDLPANGVLYVGIHDKGGSYEVEFVAENDDRYIGVKQSDNSYKYKKVVTDSNFKENRKYYDLGAWISAEDIGGCDFSTLIYSVYNKTYHMNNPIIISGFVDENRETLYKDIRTLIFGSEIASGYGVLTFKVDSIGMMEITYSLTHQTGVYMMTSTGTQFTKWKRIDNAVYTKLSDIGLTAPTTVLAISQALKAGEKLELFCTSTEITDLINDVSEGILYVHNVNGNTWNIEYIYCEMHYYGWIYNNSVQWYTNALHDDLITVYRSIRQLGLTAGCTSADIINALNPNTAFKSNMTKSNITDLPADGALFIERNVDGKPEVKLTSDTDIYEGIYSSGGVDWYRINNRVEMDTLVDMANITENPSITLANPLSEYTLLMIDVFTTLKNMADNKVSAGTSTFPIRTFDTNDHAILCRKFNDDSLAVLTVMKDSNTTLSIADTFSDDENFEATYVTVYGIK